ncbi:MAG: hypothetical protein VW829_19220, partial [Deltaproteobacteria bacterium]
LWKGLQNPLFPKEWTNSVDPANASPKQVLIGHYLLEHEQSQPIQSLLLLCNPEGNPPEDNFFESLLGLQKALVGQACAATHKATPVVPRDGGERQ